MGHRAALVAVSAAQLATGLGGLVVAVRHGRHYDLPFMHGSPAHVARDSLWFGTAYSAPAPMLVVQLWATVQLARGDDRAAGVLALLGALMTPGYLVERFDRHALRHWDPVESPIVALGVGLAAAMAALGRQAGSPA